MKTKTAFLIIFLFIISAGLFCAHKIYTNYKGQIKGRYISLEKRIELPVFEETQMGMTLGMALNGSVPISIFPRWNFLILATNQIVNHLDKILKNANKIGLISGASTPQWLVKQIVRKINLRKEKLK